MDYTKELFWADIDSGEMHIRDKWQFALKSDFIPHDVTAQNTYIQESYLFVPNSLQINSNTYSKIQFYLDQTSLIRYKTPEFSFDNLLNINNPYSPLTRLLILSNELETPELCEQLADELKLLANVVRSTLREETKRLIQLLNAAPRITTAAKEFIEGVSKLRQNIFSLRHIYAKNQNTFLDKWKDTSLYRQWIYIDEFMSDIISRYTTGILKTLRHTTYEHFLASDEILCDIILKEKKISETYTGPIEFPNDPENTLEKENFAYRANLLNKFVLDALLLTTNRFSLDQRYQHWIGAISAGVAVAIYFVLFATLGTVFVINSAPFLTIAAGCYILKDRMKDWIRGASYQQASRWFPDYTTIIRSLNGKRNLGVIKESFSMLEPKQLSQQVRNMRNEEFHTVLESFQRPENVVYYKREIKINNPSKKSDRRRLGLNVIFRLNIQHFLYKASDPVENRLSLNPVTQALINIHLPKVYHLNLIMKNTVLSSDRTPKVEYKKLRIVVDKNGIKRIEQIS